MSGHGRYLFAVASNLDPEHLQQHTGLDGEPLSVVEHEGLQAVVCDVDLSEYGEAPLREHLEQLNWGETVARTHDAVVRAVAGGANVVPMRLVTVFLDDEGVVQRLRQWGPALRAALKRVEGCREWSVKAYQTVEMAVPSTSYEAAARTGTAYLQRKKQESGRRERLDQEATESAEAVHVALAGRSRASRVLAPQDPQLTGRSERMLLNGAYLVPDVDEPAFRTLVDELRARHRAVLIEAAGPWAPYSFAVLEMPDDH